MKLEIFQEAIGSVIALMNVLSESYHTEASNYTLIVLVHIPS